jgi:hypothetical protein
VCLRVEEPEFGGHLARRWREDGEAALRSVAPTFLTAISTGTIELPTEVFT